MKEKIIPPEQRIPSRTYRVKIKETVGKRLVAEENIYILEPDDFEKVEYKPYDTTKEKEEDLPKLKYVLDKVYLQRIDNDPSKMLVTLYMDYGYLRPNCVKELVIIDKKKRFLSQPQGKCIFRLFNADLYEIAEIPLKHSSEFRFHPVSAAPQLFLGLVENLEERKEYYYRIECYNYEGRLIAATKVHKIIASVQSPSKQIFYVSTSDLHGGHAAKFKRGKARGSKVKNNPDLLRLMEDINLKEFEYTFDWGYQAFTTSGDNVDNGSYHEYWADLFSCASKNFSNMPVFPTIGNHDYYNGGIGRGSMLGGKNRTQKHFHMFMQTPRKKGGAFYSHEEGNVHMIHLDSMSLKWGNESIACDSRQWEWLNQDLKEWRRKKEEENGPEFCIVFLHSAIFTIGFFGRSRNNSDAIAQTRLTPLFDKYNVTAAIFGHDHMYQRSRWNNTSYICIGLSGKVPINYFDKLREKTEYKINKDIEGNNARGYGVTYVPPNDKTMSFEEKNDFSIWLRDLKEAILSSDLTKFYAFEGGKESEEYMILMTDNIKKNAFIDREIIEKMKNCIWWRYYNLKGEVIDQVFLPKIDVSEEDESIKCPAFHIR